MHGIKWKVHHIIFNEILQRTEYDASNNFDICYLCMTRHNYRKQIYLKTSECFDIEIELLNNYDCVCVVNRVFFPGPFFSNFE